jgi:hypothetical protein
MSSTMENGKMLWSLVDEKSSKMMMTNTKMTVSHCNLKNRLSSLLNEFPNETGYSTLVLGAAGVAIQIQR